MHKHLTFLKFESVLSLTCYVKLLTNYEPAKKHQIGFPGRFVKEFDKQIGLFHLRSVVQGMGDGSMAILTIADPDKEGIVDYLKSPPSRHTKLMWSDCGDFSLDPEGVSQGPIGKGHHQNGVEYPSP